MRILILFLSLALIPANNNAQKRNLPEIEAHFFALIVKDMDASISWYSENLGFEIINLNEYPKAGFKQANLKRGNNRIELIELKSALSPDTAIPDYDGKTRLIGFFKMGFSVSNFDVFIEHLNENKVKFHGTIVVNEETKKRMVIVKDPDENRIQLFEN
ncbi:MAG: VOC family protein [Flavobacteriaceae bacterium]|nr:VOC family protein [Flavobacteriaceae bacterium]